MKIAYLAPEFLPPWGGVGIYSVELVKGLAALGVEVHVFTPKRGSDYNPEWVKSHFKGKVELHNISEANDTFVYNFKFQAALFRQFLEIHKRENFDLIHAANLVHMPDVFLKMRHPKIPTIVTVHTTIKGQVQGFLRSNRNFFRMAPSEKGSFMLYPMISLLEKYYMKNTPYAICPSYTFARIVDREFSYKGTTEVIHYGIDKKVFNAKVKPMLRHKKPVVLYAGRLITQKGIEHFCQLMKDLDAYFLIAGIGDPNQFYQFAKGIPEEKYKFLGAVPHDDLPGVYKAADIFVNPSYYENFPISIMEAMSMECACVGTNVGAVNELIQDNTGFIVEAGDYVTLKNRVQYLIADKKARVKMGAAGRKHILKNLTTEILAKKTLEFYKKVLAK